jgi:hypothetical protein
MQQQRHASCIMHQPAALPQPPAPQAAQPAPAQKRNRGATTRVMTTWHATSDDGRCGMAQPDVMQEKIDAAVAKIWARENIRFPGTLVVPGPNPKVPRGKRQEAKMPDAEVRTAHYTVHHTTCQSVARLPLCFALHFHNGAAAAVAAACVCARAGQARACLLHHPF